MLENLFSPLRIGPIEIANRLCMSCMAGGFAVDERGYPNERMIAYYAERARARPGMMGIGAGTAVKCRIPETRHFSPVLYEDECIPAYRRFTDAIHEHDTKFGIQLWDGGIQSGAPVQLTPSGIGLEVAAVGDTSRKQIIHTLERDEIPGIVRQFGDAAERCVAAGFDFVEIHAGHGYLISSFMTPHFNRRCDEYGGSFENRTRFMLEILREVKARTAGRVAVGVKINGDDFLPANGWTLADACRIAPVLETEGADYISVTAGVMGAPRLTVPPLYEPQGCFVELAEVIKPTVSIPVSVVGRIKQPRMAEDLVARGKVDMVFMGRPMIADPDLVDKARRGVLDEIRPCLADCRGCLDHQMRTIRQGETPATSCIVNPRVGRELDCVDVPGNKRENPRKVLVIGGGCAGMEAARRAAFSGHTVVLCEAGDRLGGQLRLAERMPGRSEIGEIVPWYERQLEKLGVELRLGAEVGQSEIETIAPEVAIIATGSQPSVPQDFVGALMNAGEIPILLADEALTAPPPVSGIVLIVGGEQIGMQAADYLSEAGAKVVVAEAGGHFAGKLAANDRWYLTGRLLSKGVQRIKHVSSIEIDETGLVTLRTPKESIPLHQIGMIVLASQRRSNRALAETTTRMGIETHVIGDANDVNGEESGTIFANLAQGYDVARAL